MSRASIYPYELFDNHSPKITSDKIIENYENKNYSGLYSQEKIAYKIAKFCKALLNDGFNE